MPKRQPTPNKGAGPEFGTGLRAELEKRREEIDPTNAELLRVQALPPHATRDALVALRDDLGGERGLSPG